MKERSRKSTMIKGKKTNKNRGKRQKIEITILKQSIKLQPTRTTGTKQRKIKQIAQVQNNKANINKQEATSIWANEKERISLTKVPGQRPRKVIPKTKRLKGSGRTKNQENRSKVKGSGLQKDTAKATGMPDPTGHQKSVPENQAPNRPA